ncbi:methyltransferase domain-containing protein [Candidatus Omnitrophota bacterium]
MSDMVKLHLGCGTNKLEGWVNIDSVAACQPDIVADITAELPYEEASVDEILAEDLLEHFDKYMRFVVFYQWVRVLKVGGTITIQVPNFKKILLKYFKFGFDNFVDFIFGENLWGSKVYLGHYGNHKWGYSLKSLTAFVKHFGIDVCDVQKKGLNIRLIGRKVRQVSYEEVSQIQIPSHANRCGDGEASVSFGTAHEKIKDFYRSMNRD